MAHKYRASPAYGCLSCGCAPIPHGLWPVDGDPICPACKSPEIRRFDSTGEARRYGELWAMQKRGEISDLHLQARMPLFSQKGVKIAAYVIDFTYLVGDKQVYEEYKGAETPMYRLKRKWFEADYGVEVKVTRA